MVSGIDTSVLLAYYQSRSGATLTGLGSGAGSTAKTVKTPTPPWSADSGVARASALVTGALAGKAFINEGAAQLDVAGSSPDYRKLFALYQGLNTLYGLAEQASKKGVSDTEVARLQTTFDKGLAQVSSYVSGLKLAQIRLTDGAAMISDQTSVGVARPTTTYTTGTLFTGEHSDLPPQFQGDVAIKVDVKKLGVTKTVSIDLGGMQSTPRTFGNVVAYMNQQMTDQGVATRFAMQRTAAQPRTITVGDQKVTLPAVGDAFSLQVLGDSAEQVTFSAAVNAPSVYLTTKGGNPDPDKDAATNDAVYSSTLTKTDLSGLGAEGSQVFSHKLDDNIVDVRASKTGADGSLYVLADVKGAIGGQALQGSQDVALQKYDSAGNLLYSRTLGAADQASGLALAIGADGKVAVAGSVTGALAGAVNGPLNSAPGSDKTDSFVTLYDANGDEVWTQRRGAQENDEAQAVAIGDDGVVYVAGRTQSGLPSGGGAVSPGGLVPDYDSYLMAVSADANGAPKTLFTRQFGGAGADSVSGLAVSNGQVVVAGMEDKNAVLRSFDVAATGTTVTRTTSNGVLTVQTDTFSGGANTGSTTQTYNLPLNPDGSTPKDGVTSKSYIASATVVDGATRDLGDLQGGSLAGIAFDGGDLYLGGTTRNASLGVGGSNNGYSGGLDAFAARVSFDLTDSSDDSLAYVGAAGDEKVTGMAEADGQVWLVGKASSDFPAGSAISAQDGFLAGVDMDSGALVSARRLTGRDGYFDGAGIAIDPSGASDLDAFGLPKGTMTFGDASQLLTSATSVRAGDTFQVRNKEGGTYKTITIDSGETLTSLATKISSATGFSAKVQVLSLGSSKKLQISPANPNASIEIGPGKAGADALGALGLSAGVIRQTSIDSRGKTVSADGGGAVFGLNLATSYDLSDKAALKTAMDGLMASIGVVQRGYSELNSLANPIKATTPTGAGKTGGTVPTYLSNEIANYQAALRRLGGG